LVTSMGSLHLFLLVACMPKSTYKDNGINPNQPTKRTASGSSRWCGAWMMHSQQKKKK